MSETRLTSFAVAGVGKLGLAVVNGLVAASPRTILVLTRDPSKLNDLHPSVKVAKIDYTDADGIAKVLEEHQIDTLVSTVFTHAMDSQYPLAEAAKKANIKLFVPSEFGFPTDGAKEGLFKEKDDFKNHLISLGIPYMRCYNGTFIDYMPYICGYKASGKVHIVGNGDVPISFTAIADIGGFVAHAISTQPLSKIANKTYRLEGHRATFLEIARIFDAAYLNQVETIPARDEQEAGFFKFVQTYMNTGYANVSLDLAEGRFMSYEEITERGEDPKSIWEGHVFKRIGDLPV